MNVLYAVALESDSRRRCSRHHALFAEFSAKGVRIRSAPQNFSWAYEFTVEDPDGHVLRFGSEPKP